MKPFVKKLLAVSVPGSWTTRFYYTGSTTLGKGNQGSTLVSAVHSLSFKTELDTLIIA